MLKSTIQALVLAVGLMTGVSAFATGGPSSGGSSSSGGGRVQCRAYDTGWEEHGSHGSCGECLGRHSECAERCYSYSYECTARGTDSRGMGVTFSAYGRDEYRTRDQALNRCYSSNAQNCSVERCTEDSNLVSSRTCQR